MSVGEERPEHTWRKSIHSIDLSDVPMRQVFSISGNVWTLLNWIDYWDRGAFQKQVNFEMEIKHKGWFLGLVNFINWDKIKLITF